VPHNNEFPEGVAVKNKNIILIAVAVGCGLVAALVTSKMWAKPPAPETVKVAVAKEEITQGTRMTKENIEKFVEYKTVPKDTLPKAYIDNVESMEGQWVTRMIRVGETINPVDLSDKTAVKIPTGMNMVSYAFSLESAVTGFAGPNSRVDVECTMTMNNSGGRNVTFYILIDQLVLAIDKVTDPIQGSTIANVNNVSFAMTPKQQRMLTSAFARGARFRMALRNPNAPVEIPADMRATDEEIQKYIDDKPEDKSTTVVAEKSTPKVARMPQPTEVIKAGTMLDAETLKKFKYVEFTPPATAGMANDLIELAGMIVTKDLEPNVYVPMTSVTGKFMRLEPSGSNSPSEKDPLAELLEREKPKGKPLVFRHQTIQDSKGLKKYRWQILESGEQAFIGEVTDDGLTVEVTPPVEAPKKAPTDGKTPADKPV